MPLQPHSCERETSVDAAAIAPYEYLERKREAPGPLGVEVFARGSRRQGLRPAFSFLPVAADSQSVCCVPLLGSAAAGLGDQTSWRRGFG